MRTLASYLRVILFTIISGIFLLYIVSPNNPADAFSELSYWLALSFASFLMVVGEIILGAIQRILLFTLSSEAKKNYEEALIVAKQNRFKRLKHLYKKLLGSRPIEDESEIVIDHDYDGIVELDNRLPPWWVYGFYITILFAFIYLVRFHVFKDYNQAEEYEKEVAIAKEEIAKWRETAKDLVDANTVSLLTDSKSLASGKAIFMQSCVACHKQDGGGGIGPNLTDPYWILGGGIKNVFNTISEGGRAGKGMVPWKTELKPSEIAEVSSYVLSLQGTTPQEPKAAEGDLWEAATSTQNNTEEKENNAPNR